MSFESFGEFDDIDALRAVSQESAHRRQGLMSSLMQTLAARKLEALNRRRLNAVNDATIEPALARDLLYAVSVAHLDNAEGGRSPLEQEAAVKYIEGLYAIFDQTQKAAEDMQVASPESNLGQAMMHASSDVFLGEMSSAPTNATAQMVGSALTRAVYGVNETLADVFAAHIEGRQLPMLPSTPPPSEEGTWPPSA